ncbi:MAG: hypothetical protein [Caudoviricetes sp.]|nr:MAG: hypothetical protein [Caudoviricetes sp.]
MADFLDTINEWIEEVEATVDDVIQTIAIKVGTQVITMSPVDTGLFKGNWQMTIDETSDMSLLRYDQTGDRTIAALAAKANSFTAGQIAYIQNHVLYGYDLEYGSSTQAPDGMVRLTEAQFLRIVEDAIRLSR